MGVILPMAFKRKVYNPCALAVKNIDQRQSHE